LLLDSFGENKKTHTHGNAKLYSYICETMRRDALRGELQQVVALRATLLRWMDASVGYLERHASALGDAREPLRCNLCVVVREYCARLDVARGTIAGGVAAGLRLPTPLLRRLIALFMHWSRGLAHVVALDSTLARVRDVARRRTIVLKLRVHAINLQCLAVAAIASLLRQALPAGGGRLAARVLDWIDALLRETVPTPRAAVRNIAAPVHREQSAVVDNSGHASATDNADRDDAPSSSTGGIDNNNSSSATTTTTTNTTAATATSANSNAGATTSSTAGVANNVTGGANEVGGGGGSTADDGDSDRVAGGGSHRSEVDADDDIDAALNDSQAGGGRESSSAAGATLGAGSSSQQSTHDSKASGIGGGGGGAGTSAGGNTNVDAASNSGLAKPIDGGGVGGGSSDAINAGGKSKLRDVGNPSDGGSSSHALTSTGGTTSSNAAAAAGNVGSNAVVGSGGASAVSSGGGGNSGANQSIGDVGKESGDGVQRVTSNAAASSGGGGGAPSSSSSTTPGAGEARADSSATSATRLSASNARRLTALLRACLEALFVANSVHAEIIAAAVDRCYALDTHAARTYASALIAFFRQRPLRASIGLVDLINLLTYLAGHPDRALRRTAIDMAQLAGSGMLWPSKAQRRAATPTVIDIRAPTPVRAFVRVVNTSSQQQPTTPAKTTNTTTTTTTTTKTTTTSNDDDHTTTALRSIVDSVASTTQPSTVTSQAAVPRCVRCHAILSTNNTTASHSTNAGGGTLTAATQDTDPAQSTPRRR
jgi:hypothetical protein